MDVTKLVLAILALVSTVMTTVIVPWVKIKITEAKAKLNEQQQNNLVKWAKIAVDAAEMIYTESGAGKMKKAFVEKFMVDYLSKHNIAFDSEQVNLAIEAAVLELKNSVTNK